MKIRALQILVGSGIVCVVAGLCLLVWPLPEDENQSESTIQAPTSREPEKTPSATQPKNTENKGSGALSKTETIATKAEDEEVPGAASLNETTRDSILALMVEIKRGPITFETRGLIQQIERDEGDVAGLLLKLYRAQGSTQKRNAVIKALGKLNSQAAKDALLNIALKPGGDARVSTGRVAVKTFAKLTQNSSELCQLIATPVPGVRTTAVRVLGYKELTQTAVDALGTLLNTPSWGTVSAVAGAFATDKSALTVETKVDLLLDSLPEINSIIPEDERVPAPVYWTPREMVRVSYIGALSSMIGADKSLRHHLRTAEAPERNVIVIALANRNHADIRPELLNIIKTEKDGFIRTMAVNALENLATKDDIPLLEELIRSDTFNRPFRAHSPTEKKREHVDFPVRYAANQLLKHLHRTQK